MEGYCLKCKTKKEMKDAKEVTMKNGRKAMKGKCLDCGIGMFKILGKKQMKRNLREDMDGSVYCAECKTKRKIVNVEEVFVSKRYRLIKGRCSGCATGMFKILGKKQFDY